MLPFWITPLFERYLTRSISIKYNNTESQLDQVRRLDRTTIINRGRPERRTATFACYYCRVGKGDGSRTKTTSEAASTYTIDLADCNNEVDWFLSMYMRELLLFVTLKIVGRSSTVNSPGNTSCWFINPLVTCETNSRITPHYRVHLNCR